MREQLAADARASEARAAQELIDGFVAEANRRGLAPVELRAQLFGGGLARTGVRGWYLKNNESVAIGTDGGYYILAVPGGLRERLFGTTVAPSPPPLVVSRGGRDGESGDLTDFLARRLAAG